MNELTKELLDELLHYDMNTGYFTWKVRARCYFKSESSWKSWNTRYSNTRVGSIDGKGYLHVSIFKKLYRLHRLVFLHLYGEIPKYVDHINRDKTDNRIENLRPCDCKGNAGNSGVHSHNTSGYRGVSLNSKTGKYHAQIKIHGKQTYIGRFDTKIEAAVAYNKKAQEHFGEFATIN